MHRASDVLQFCIVFIKSRRTFALGGADGCVGFFGIKTPSRDEQLQRSILEKLAASHAFAQSSKLSSFAESVQKSIEDTRGLAEELAYQGEIVSQVRPPRLR